MESPERAVVVGIGSDGYDSALLYAVDQVRRSHRPLHLLHVLELPKGAPHTATNLAALRRARMTIDDAVRTARRWARTTTGQVLEERLAHGATLPEARRRTSCWCCSTAPSLRSIGSSPDRSSRPWLLATGAGRVCPRGLEASGPRATVATAAVQMPGRLRAAPVAFEAARARAAALVVLHAGGWPRGSRSSLLTTPTVPSGPTAASRRCSRCSRRSGPSSRIRSHAGGATLPTPRGHPPGRRTELTSSPRSPKPSAASW